MLELFELSHSEFSLTALASNFIRKLPTPEDPVLSHRQILLTVAGETKIRKRGLGLPNVLK